MNWGGWARQIVDLVDFDVERKGHVMPEEFEALVVQEVIDVPFGTREKIIQAKHLMPLRQ
jgi:hypothetical protein